MATAVVAAPPGVSLAQCHSPVCHGSISSRLDNNSVALPRTSAGRITLIKHQRQRCLAGTPLDIRRPLGASCQSSGRTHSRPITRSQASNGSGGEKMTVAITGGTGFVGSRLVQKLLEEGHKVRVLTRSATNARSVFSGKANGQPEIVEPAGWAAALHGCTGVVNLAGTPISTRWTPEIKAEIKQSRVDVTSKLAAAINAAPEEQRPKVLVSSSALGFYGTSDNLSFDESSPSGSDYLAEVCREWEAQARRAEGVRLVLLRTGIVLDRDGGALGKMLPIFNLFAGGPIGSGKQWFSWVHRDDLVGLIVEALKNPAYQGVINGTAPNPVRFVEMCEQLGRALGRPSWLPVPEFAIRAILGDGASVVLDGQKVLPKRAQELGFAFRYRYISEALSAILS